MSDIQRAIDKQAKLEAEATAGPWENPWHGSPEDSALTTHLRNQAKLARAALQAAAETLKPASVTPKTLAQLEIDLQTKLSAWADHVNGETNA